MVVYWRGSLYSLFHCLFVFAHMDSSSTGITILLCLLILFGLAAFSIILCTYSHRLPPNVCLDFSSCQPFLLIFLLIPFALYLSFFSQHVRITVKTKIQYHTRKPLKSRYPLFFDILNEILPAFTDLMFWIPSQSTASWERDWFHLDHPVEGKPYWQPRRPALHHMRHYLKAQLTSSCRDSALDITL